MTDTPRVHVVVCTRNNRDIIAATLHSIEAQQWPGLTCTLVDGLSSDGTPQFVREHFPWVRVIVKAQDSGPAASRNLGSKDCTAELVVFLDSDVCLTPGWIAAQRELMCSDPRIAIACGKVVYQDRPDILNMTYGALNRLTVAWDADRDRPEHELTSIRHAIWCASAAIMVRRAVLDEMGGFDEAMFAYHEDTDLGWRANLFGYHVTFNPAAMATHRAHSTMNTTTMGRRIAALAWRNRLRSALVNYEAINLARYLPLYLVLGFGIALLAGELRENLGAILWNLRHLEDIRRRRRFVQGGRRVRDADLWPLFATSLRGPGR